MSPLAGVLPIATAVTAGATSLLPSTLWSAEFAIAALPRPSVALPVPPRNLIVPPFNANALAPMLMPFASASAACTM